MLLNPLQNLSPEQSEVLPCVIWSGEADESGGGGDAAEGFWYVIVMNFSHEE